MSKWEVGKTDHVETVHADMVTVGPAGELSFLTRYGASEAEMVVPGELLVLAPGTWTWVAPLEEPRAGGLVSRMGYQNIGGQMNWFNRERKPDPVPAFKVGDQVLHSDARTGPVGPHWNHRRAAVVVTSASPSGRSFFYDIRYEDGTYWSAIESSLTRLELPEEGKHKTP